MSSICVRLSLSCAVQESRERFKKDFATEMAHVLARLLAQQRLREHPTEMAKTQELVEKTER